jgi:hypothetical protein
MDEQAAFETRAILAPRRGRLGRLVLVVPAIALVAVAWAGVSGARSDPVTASIAASSAAPAVVPPVSGADGGARIGPEYPARVLGLDVHRLDEVGPAAVGRGEVRAVAGWYVATTTIDCAPLAATFRGATSRGADAPGSNPRPDSWVADSWAYCDRFGLLYASRPDMAQRPPTNNLEDNRSKSAGLPVVPAVLAFGVVAPRELEVLGGEATPVVFLAHVDDTGADCSVPAHCGRALVVDHVAWTPAG